MTGREDSVIERFRKDLRKVCERTRKIDLNAPLNGADRYVNADEFFAVGGRFFLVEFKSSQHNLRDENRKGSACDLCDRLQRSPHARDLHDRGHFAAWGKKRIDGPLAIQIDVYRLLVCCERVLPDCPNVKGLTPINGSRSSDEVLDRIISEQAGLEADDFKTYLQWLFNIVGADGNPTEFPLTVFGYTYAEGVFDKEFQSYADFGKWASAAVSNAKKMVPGNKMGSSFGMGN